MTEEDGRRILVEVLNRGPLIVWSPNPHAVGDVLPMVTVASVTSIGGRFDIFHPFRVVREATEDEYLRWMPHSRGLWMRGSVDLWFYEVIAD